MMFTSRYKYASELEDFVCDVVSVMQHWLDVHTDREAWTEMWLCGEDASQVAKNSDGKVNNNYFSFDWRAAALKVWCERNTDDFYRCGNCRSINENGSYCDSEDECADTDDDETVTAEDLAEWMNDIYYGQEIYNLVTDSDWENALADAGFDVYRDALEQYTCVIEEEVTDVLAALNNATNGDELLLALTWALHTAHVHGNIIEDWTDDTPGVKTGDLYSKLCDVQQNGLSSVFEQSDIDDLFGTTTTKETDDD